MELWQGAPTAQEKARRFSITDEFSHRGRAGRAFPDHGPSGFVSAYGHSCGSLSELGFADH
jgi:hypothetical protein